MHLKLTLICLVLAIQSTDASHNWSYKGSTGPRNWPNLFPACGKNRQSPIDMDVCDTEYRRRRITNNYNGRCAKPTAILKNNGHSAQVDIGNAAGLYTNVFCSKFKPLQVHFHWGDNALVGSEHTVNGRHYAAEMHFVHRNTKYSSIAEAIKHRDGLLVLGTFIKIGKFNHQLQPIFKNLFKVRQQGSNSTIHGLKIGRLLPPRAKNFFFYDGSLTTPTCNQAVKWIIFNSIIDVSFSQMRQLRLLLHNGQEKLMNNFRPTQPLNGRRIYRSFHLGSDVCECQS